MSDIYSESLSEEEEAAFDFFSVFLSFFSFLSFLDFLTSFSDSDSESEESEELSASALRFFSEATLAGEAAAGVVSCLVLMARKRAFSAPKT